jgi:hypothetical protein
MNERLHDMNLNSILLDVRVSPLNKKETLMIIMMIIVLDNQNKM